MTDAPTPERPETAGVAVDRIEVANGVHWRRYTSSSASEARYELVCPNDACPNIHTATEAQARAFAAALAPPPGAPAPLAEVERLLSTVMAEAHISGQFDQPLEQGNAQLWAGKVLTAVARLSDRCRAAPGAMAVPEDLMVASADATPGPWVAESEGGKGAWIKGSTGEWAALSCGDTDATADANGVLIAAAVNRLRDEIAASPPPDGAARDAGAGDVPVCAWRGGCQHVVACTAEQRCIGPALRAGDALRAEMGRPAPGIEPSPGAEPAGRHDGGVA